MDPIMASIILALIVAGATIVAASILGRRRDAGPLRLDTRTAISMMFWGVGVYFAAEGIWTAVNVHEWTPFLVMAPVAAILYAIGSVIYRKRPSPQST